MVRLLSIFEISVDSYNGEDNSRKAKRKGSREELKSYARAHIICGISGLFLSFPK
jgi:hypothetical protein